MSDHAIHAQHSSRHILIRAFKCKIKYVSHYQFVSCVDLFVYLMIFVCAILVTGGFVLLICLKKEADVPIYLAIIKKLMQWRESFVFRTFCDVFFFSFTCSSFCLWPVHTICLFPHGVKVLWLVLLAMVNIKLAFSYPFRAISIHLKKLKLNECN